MKKIVFFVFSVVFICCCFSCKSEKKTELLNITNIEKNKYQCSFDDIIHDFIIELPEHVENAPLVVLLPGLNLTPENMKVDTGFEKEACARGYAVVYVKGSVQKGQKGSGVGWNCGIYLEGNDDVGFLVALAEYLQKEYGFDKKRTFAAGFSNGGFMMHRLAMEGQKTFRACVSVAGRMPSLIWKNANKKNKVGFFQISGEKDDIVPKNSDGSARHVPDPAIEDVVDYWADSNGLTVVEEEEIASGSSLTKWSSKSASAKGQVWHLFVKDGRHSWPNARMNGIDANTLILDFFDCF